MCLPKVKSSEHKMHFSGRNKFLAVFTSESDTYVFIEREGVIARWNDNADLESHQNNTRIEVYF